MEGAANRGRIRSAAHDVLVNPINRSRKLATDGQVLATVVDIADDGFASYRDIAQHLPRYGEREVRRSVSRTVRRGLLVERHGSDGRRHFALTSEGWRLHRASTVTHAAKGMGGGPDP
jgi:hypothetical protein